MGKDQRLNTRNKENMKTILLAAFIFLQLNCYGYYENNIYIKDEYADVLLEECTLKFQFHIYNEETKKEIIKNRMQWFFNLECRLRQEANKIWWNAHGEATYVQKKLKEEIQRRRQHISKLKKDLELLSKKNRQSLLEKTYLSKTSQIKRHSKHLRKLRKVLK